MKKLTYSLIFSLIGLSAFGQIKITDGAATAADGSSVLDLASTSKGVLLPRMSTSERTAITNPAPGLTVFDTDKKTIYTNNGTAATPAWTAILSSGNVSTTSSVKPVTDNNGTNVLGFSLVDGTASGQVLQWNGSAWGLATVSGGGGGGTLGSTNGNTVGGYNAGSAISTGQYNTFLGQNVGATTTTGSNNIAIGFGVGLSSATADNEINIGGFLKAKRVDTNGSANTLEASYWSMGNTVPEDETTLYVLGRVSINDGDLQIQNGFLTMKKSDEICGVKSAAVNKVVTFTTAFENADDYLVLTSRTYGTNTLTVSKLATGFTISGTNTAGDYCVIALR